MRNLSTEFKFQQNSGNRNYLKYADFTFTDGSTLSITDKDLWSNGFKFEDAVSQSGSFDIGAAIVNKLTLQINNFSGDYTDYIWDGARVVCHIGLELSTGIEKIRICTMTVTDAPYQNTAIISLTCEDSMRKFDRDYSESKLTYPATRLQIIQDACEVCGVTLQSTRFDNDDFVIQNRPDDSSITFRQVIAWVAQMGCQWAKTDAYGRLCLEWYKNEVPENFYNKAEVPWKDIEGEDILDTTGAQIITVMQKGITAIDTNGFTPWLYDVEITGVKVTEYVENSSQNEVKTYQSGKSGYVIEISDNKLIQEGTGGTICQIIADRCVGMKFRPFTTGALTNIAWEAGDTIAISDRNGKKYKSFLTSVTLNPGAFEQLECSAKSVSRNKQKQYSLNQQVQAENKKNLRDERTAREKAIDDLSNRLAESPGVYTTVEPQLDGSNIYYLHNKPNIEDSDIIWKMTAEAWAVSTDGGKHWNGGMTVDGDVIARILTATGVNADWIKTGALVIKDVNGNILFQADMNTKKVYIDGSVQIGGGVSLNDIKKTAEDAKKAASLAKNMTMQLSNEFQSIPVDSDGNYAVFPARVTTRPIVMYGSQNITSECSYTISKSDNVTGEWDDASKIYTVTGLSADTGWVDIQATYINTLVITKRFSLAKQYAGRQGESGEAGRTYFIELSSNILKRGQDGYVKPDVLNARAYYRDGQSAARTAYPGRWLIETSTDGTNYVESVKSTSDETSKSISPNLFSHIVSVRVTLYASGGTENVLDTQTVPILVDVSALTQEEVFNLLTNNGEVKGLYKEGNQLFISFSYAKGGQLTLGGNDNQNGTLEVLNAKGNVIGSIKNGGIQFSYADFNTALIKSYFAMYTKGGNTTPTVYYQSGEKDENCVFQINCPVRIKSGGWYMTDDDWIRTYNEKSIYSGAGVIRSDYCFVNNVDGKYWQFGAKVGTDNAEWFGFMDATDGNLALAIIKSTHSIRTWGEIQAESANGLRIVNGNYGFIIRNDGSNVYLMPTTQGDPYGTWNDKAYSVINLATGQWTIPDDHMNKGCPILTKNSTGNRIITINKSSSNIQFRAEDGNYNVKPDSSDIRLKKNLGKVEIEDALSIIKEIKLHSFDWKPDGSHQQIGFIADELEQLDDRFSYGGGEDENGKPNYKSIDTLYMLGYTVKAIQELSEENKLLKKEISSIKEELMEIKNIKKEIKNAKLDRLYEETTTIR